MSHNLELAQKHAWSLARTLMITVILFKSDNEYGVLPADEIEDAEVTPLFEYDPFAGAPPSCPRLRMRIEPVRDSFWVLPLHAPVPDDAPAGSGVARNGFAVLH